MDANSQLNWTYRLENHSERQGEPDWVEVFETTYEGKPVFVGVRVRAHSNIPQDFDYLILRIYSGQDKKDFVGLAAGVRHPEMTTFFKPLEGGGQTSMNPEERPNLERFVTEYKPIFASQRDLRETYKYLL